jgi:hypothetical protein
MPASATTTSVSTPPTAQGIYASAKLGTEETLTERMAANVSSLFFLLLIIIVVVVVSIVVIVVAIVIIVLIAIFIYSIFLRSPILFFELARIRHLF